MAKSRPRGACDAVREEKLEKARDAVDDMEMPLNQLLCLLRALELMGAGMRGRGDSEIIGEAVSVVADCALDRVTVLKKHRNAAFDAVFKES